MDVTTWPLARLIEHIISAHHTRVRHEGARIEGYLVSLSARHGAAHPELLRLEAVFSRMYADLLQHIQNEERILFPYIEGLADAERRGRTVPRPAFETVGNPIRVMEAEHHDAATDLALIRGLTLDYTVPVDGNAAWRACYRALAEFDRAEQEHVRLENEVLFPAAIRLEQGRLVPVAS